MAYVAQLVQAIASRCFYAFPRSAFAIWRRSQRHAAPDHLLLPVAIAEIIRSEAHPKVKALIICLYR
jgi:hypothetical protein